MLLGKEVAESSTVPDEMAPTVAEFSDIFHNDILDRLLPYWIFSITLTWSQELYY